MTWYHHPRYGDFEEVNNEDEGEQTMKTRQRENGTMDFFPQDAEQRLQAFRHIVAEKQFAKIDDCMVDLFSASCVTQVFDKLNPANQLIMKARIFTKPADKVVFFCLKLVK